MTVKPGEGTAEAGAGQAMGTEPFVSTFRGRDSPVRRKGPGDIAGARNRSAPSRLASSLAAPSGQPHSL
jgi:hypothetical protein